MTPLSAFRSRIAPRVPTALDIAIDAAVLDTCIDFCEQTYIIKGMLDPFSTVANQREYDIDASASQQNVIKIMRAWCQLMELRALSEDEIQNTSTWSTVGVGPLAYVDSVAGVNTITTRPRAFTEVAPGRIAFLPMPDAVYPITIRAAMKPKRSATQVEDVLYENWVEDIVNGAMYRLHSIPGMPFSNEGLATAHLALYRVGVNKALLEATRGRTRAEQVVRPQWV